MQKTEAEWGTPGPARPPHPQGPRPPSSSPCRPWGLGDRLPEEARASRSGPQQPPPPGSTVSRRKAGSKPRLRGTDGGKAQAPGSPGGPSSLLPRLPPLPARRGLPGAGGGSGARGFGWCPGAPGTRAAGQGWGSEPGLGSCCGAAWTCRGWGCGTWVPAAPGCCHPHPPSWRPSCLCCCWSAPR